MLRPGERRIDLFETVVLEYFHNEKIEYSTINVGIYSHNNSLNYSYVLWPDNNLPQYELPLSVYIEDFDYPNAAALEVENRIKKSAVEQLEKQGFAKKIPNLFIRSGFVDFPIYYFPSIE